MYSLLYMYLSYFIKNNIIETLKMKKNRFFKLKRIAAVVFVFLLGLNQQLLAQPNWSVNPVEFGGNMSYTGWVIINEEVVGHEDDLLAAFHNGDCRGVVSPTYNVNSDRWLFFLTVFGDTQGEIISFKYYDSQQDLEIDLETEVSFIANHQYGSPLEPKATADANTDLSLAELTAYSLPNQWESSIYGDTVYILRPNSLPTSNLIAEFTASPGSLVQVGSNSQFSSITPNDFDQVVNYTITSGDGVNSKEYFVKVVDEKMSVVASVFINEVEVANATDSLFAYINGVLVAKNEATYVPALDKYRFELLVSYFTVDGEVFDIDFIYKDGLTEQETAVLPNLQFSSSSSVGTQFNPLVLSDALLVGHELETFAIPGQMGETLYRNDSLFIRMPSTNDYTSLIPAFTHSAGAIVTVADSVQYSEFTANDFTNYVTYRVYNQDRSSFTNYVVQVSNITQGYVASVWINGEEVATNDGELHVSWNGFDLGSVSPTYVPAIDKYRFEISPVHFFPEETLAFTYVDNLNQSYSLVPTDVEFNEGEQTGTQFNPLVLSDVLLEDHELETFTIPGQTGSTLYRNDSIFIRLSTSVNYSNLTPNFTHSPGAIVTLQDSVQYSGYTSNDFTDYVTYKVYNQLRSSFTDYVVKISFPRQNSFVSVWIDGEEVNIND